jgi:MoxR-like ATPase
MSPTDVQTLANRIIANMEKVIIGKRRQLVLALSAYLCEGHILLEDVPGTAKTMFARALARSVNCTFKRIQCTPDLLPTDVTGVSIFNQKTTEFEFRPGPIFAQTLLADEINRATPRTQAALLEAMAERRVTADGTSYQLKPPFLVIATQNPVDQEGTFPLPEAQLDRFLVRLSLGYPSLQEECSMLKRLQHAHPIDELAAVATAQDILAAQRAVREVHVEDSVIQYITELVHATRDHDDVLLGGSPRASLALVSHRPSYGGHRRPRLRSARRCQAHGPAGTRAPGDRAARKPPAQGVSPFRGARSAARGVGARAGASLRIDPRPL